MAGFVSGDASHHGTHVGGSYKHPRDMPEDGAHWYFPRKEIEENYLSRHDGVGLKKETYLRKSYCTLLQDLGMRLKVCDLFTFNLFWCILVLKCMDSCIITFKKTALLSEHLILSSSSF